jgi:hypothetical protein
VPLGNRLGAGFGVGVSVGVVLPFEELMRFGRVFPVEEGFVLCCLFLPDCA